MINLSNYGIHVLTGSDYLSNCIVSLGLGLGLGARARARARARVVARVRGGLVRSPAPVGLPTP